MTQDKQLEAVDLKCQEILLELGILKTSNGITYDTYVPQVHVANLVDAMKKYASQFQPEHKQVGAGVWVKASETLPEKMKQVNGKLQGRPAIVCNSKLIDGYITANGNLEPVNLVEWLDEHPQHPQPLTDSAIEKMAEKDINSIVTEKLVKYGVNVIDTNKSPIDEHTRIYVGAKKAGIEIFKSALQYSAGDKK